MSFDLLLTIAAGAAQLAMALAGTWWALRPPARKYHWLIIAVYFVIGMLGLGAIAWSSYRAQAIQEAFVKHPRLAISRFTVVPTDPPDGTNDVGIRLYYVNRGEKFGYTPAILGEMKIGNLTPAQADIIMQRVTARAEAITPPRKAESDVGQEVFRPGWRIKAADWQQVVSGQKNLYVFVALAFADDTLRPGQHWISEFAAVESKPTDVYETFKQSTFLYVKTP